MAIIPSLAIHLDRQANTSRSINAQTYLPPILGQTEEKPELKSLLQRRLEADGAAQVAQVLDYELFFYPTQAPEFIGLEQEFIASARLDNLLSCFIGLQGPDRGRARAGRPAGGQRPRRGRQHLGRRGARADAQADAGARRARPPAARSGAVTLGADFGR